MIDNQIYLSQEGFFCITNAAYALGPFVPLLLSPLLAFLTSTFHFLLQSLVSVFLPFSSLLLLNSVITSCLSTLSHPPSSPYLISAIHTPSYILPCLGASYFLAPRLPFSRSLPPNPNIWNFNNPGPLQPSQPSSSTHPGRHPHTFTSVLS